MFCCGGEDTGNCDIGIGIGFDVVVLDSGAGDFNGMRSCSCRYGRRDTEDMSTW
jgi:hypothetical protein